MSEAFITAVDSISLKPKRSAEEQEICNALNRRTEFRVLRTTFGLFDEEGNLRPDAVTPPKPLTTDEFEDYGNEGTANEEEYEYVE